MSRSAKNNLTVLEIRYDSISPSMKTFIHSRIFSFGHAFRGLFYVVRTQRNAWIHAFATVLAIIFGIWLMLPARDWAVLGLTIAMVWMAEALNTSIEAI